MSELTDFYLNFYKSLDEFNVEYMTVGGHAVIYHGYVRATSDLDLWVNTDDTNLERLFRSLIHLGYSDANCRKAVRYLKENHIIKIPKGNDKIELLDSFMLKNDFSASYRNHETILLDGVKVRLIGYTDLVRCKLQSNRPKDLLDVKSLERIRELKSSAQKIFNEDNSEVFSLKKKENKPDL